jgi:hypothetical protein
VGKTIIGILIRIKTKKDDARRIFELEKDADEDVEQINC